MSSVECRGRIDTLLSRMKWARDQYPGWSGEIRQSLLQMRKEMDAWKDRLREANRREAKMFRSLMTELCDE